MPWKWQSWGVFYTSEIPQSKDWRCLECGWSFYDYEPTLDKYRFVVGFSTEMPCYSTQYGIVGILIVECPKCFSKFFFHVQGLLLDMVVDNCPNWPDALKPPDEC